MKKEQEPKQDKIVKFEVYARKIGKKNKTEKEIEEERKLEIRRRLVQELKDTGQ